VDGVEGGERRPRWGAARERGGIEVKRRPRRLGRHTVPRCGGRRPGLFPRPAARRNSGLAPLRHRCGRPRHPRPWRTLLRSCERMECLDRTTARRGSSARTPQYRERLLRRGFRPPRNRLRLGNYPRQRPRSGPDDSSGYQSSRGTRPTMRPRPAHTSARAVPSRAKGFSAVPALGIGCS
jgi:hypothetical protein